MTSSRLARVLAATGAAVTVALAITIAAGEDVPGATPPPLEPNPSAAAVEPSVAPAILDPIVVTATRSPEALSRVPAAVSVVGQGDIQDALPTVSLSEPLNRVPGVLVQDSGNFAQDARIQIRGFGTRATFGIREVRVLIDGLPETLPDGQTELDDIDLGAIQRIEVLRGPASSLYGNSSGGVIQLFTEDGPPSPAVEGRFTGGSFGLRKYQAKSGGQFGDTNVFLQASHLDENGFRDHSATRSTNVNAKLRYDPDPSTEVTLLVNGVESPLAEDPGGLTRAEADAHPHHAAPLNVSLDAGEEVEQGRVGLVGRHRMGDAGEISGYVYALYRNFDSNQPIAPTTPPIQGGVVTFARFSPGLGVRYLIDHPVLGLANDLTLGIDVQNQDDNRRRFSNDQGERGVLGLHQQERVTSAGPYLREELMLRDDLALSAGVRYDTVHYAVDVDFPSGTGSSGSHTLDQWSPSGGIRYSPRPWLTTYANIGTAFEVPTTTELANPNGAGFNPDLQPQTATSYEAGARLDWARFSADLAAFVIDLDDELVPFELESQPGRTFFRNAGSSHRYGLELGWEAWPVAGLRWTSSVTLLHARYRSYHTDNGDFDGNQEPGIPPWQVYEELAYRHPSGLFAAFEMLAVGSFFVDDANTTRTRSEPICNLRAGYTVSHAAFSFEPFVGLENLTDANYDARIRPNAAAGRFFEPGASFGFYAGITVTARL